MIIPFLTRFFFEDTDSGLSKTTFADGLSLQLKQRFESLLLDIAGDLPDLLIVSVIDLQSGRLLATRQLGGKLNPAKAAPYHAAGIRQNQLALQIWELAPGEAIEDMLITSDTQWHVLRLLPGNRHFVHLLVSHRDTNLAIAREVLRTRTVGSPA